MSRKLTQGDLIETVDDALFDFGVELPTRDALARYIVLQLMNEGVFDEREVDFE